MTTQPGSLARLSRVTRSEAHQPATNATAAAAARPHAPIQLRIAQAQGSAASDPQVPGIPGSSPIPNPVAINAAGRKSGEPSLAQSGSRTVATACAAMPSPRPVKPSCSVVVALTLTRSGGEPEDLGDARNHGLAVRADLRPLADDRHVERGDAAALGAHQARRHGRGSGRRRRRAIAGRSAGSACRCRRRRSRRAPRRSTHAGRHRRRNGRRAPAVCGTATPQSITWSPGPNGWTSKPWPTRMSPCRAAISRSAATRSCAVVTLRFSSLPATITGAIPAASATAASSVRCRPGGLAVRREDRGEVEALRRLRPPQPGAVDRLADHAVGDPLDRVAERQAGDRRRRAVERVEHAVDQPGIGNGRAPSWISTRSGRRRASASSPCRTESCRSAPPGNGRQQIEPGDVRHRRSRGPPAGSRPARRRCAGCADKGVTACRSTRRSRRAQVLLGQRCRRTGCRARRRRTRA